MQRGILWILGLGIVSTCLVVANQSAVGKEKAKAKKAESQAPEAKSDPADGDKKVAAFRKSARRLPPYYKDVINEDQREEIVTVYAKFNTKLAELRAEIKEVTAERDKALQALLTDEQREELIRIKEGKKQSKVKQEVPEDES